MCLRHDTDENKSLSEPRILRITKRFTHDLS